MLKRWSLPLALLTVLALPVLAYFAVPPMLYLAWLSPAYWQMKALWLAADSLPFLGTLAVSAVMNVLLLVLLRPLHHIDHHQQHHHQHQHDYQQLSIAVAATAKTT